MTSSVASQQPGSVTGTRSSRPRLPMRLAALLPMWLFLVLQLQPDGLSSPMFSSPPSILGIPLIAVVGGLVAGWMLIGLVLVWDARSRLTDLLALMLFTLPATLGVLLGPALILILQNLG